MMVGKHAQLAKVLVPERVVPNLASHFILGRLA